ncbi:DNA-directed RNA polymerase sigma-70 factor [Streptomyces durbertensis]|uniref:DNA-directed RNA polymerase sigma-70 factor n=1 Tax=Streptomyces durbertensis TaxID=2448886 RepID=A0ABR6EK80_9ACTN|nr:sigma factor-like helix-turn-helix DNA-binding protein [Streptomyces durbertensis]MBB1245663.1 DNA-directed RNA polymerase sigma-70 factor [Streptomyces durbertensis]
MTFDERTDERAAVADKPARPKKPTGKGKAHKAREAAARPTDGVEHHAEHAVPAAKGRKHPKGDGSPERPPRRGVLNSPSPVWARDEAEAERHAAALVDGTPPATDDTDAPGEPDGSDAPDAADTAGAADTTDATDAAEGAGERPDADGAPDRAESGSAESESPPAGCPAAAAFDRLHAAHAGPLVRQAFLLTGNGAVARWAVERAFHTAWERWPEVARDPDPAGWVRAEAHENALTPWLRLWPKHHSPDPYTGPAELRGFVEAFWALPRDYRRALLLHDGLGLGLAEIAAETEASTPATAGRLLHAREALAEAVPDVGGRDPAERGPVVHDLLERAAAAHEVSPRPSRAVRTSSDHTTLGRTLAVCVATTALVLTTSFTIATHRTGDIVPTGLAGTVERLVR